MKFSILAAIVLALVICLVGTARAEEATTKPVDLSNPRAALKSFVEALRAGDAAGAKRACHVADEKDQKLMEVGVEFEAAFERLVTAVEKKFGDGAAAPVRDKLMGAGPTDVVPLMEKAIENAPEHTSEDAVLVPWHGAEELKLVRVEGEWKIDATGQMKNIDAKRRAQMLKQMPAAAKRLEKVITAIEEGKVTSVDELVALMGNR